MKLFFRLQSVQNDEPKNFLFWLARTTRNTEACLSLIRAVIEPWEIVVFAWVTSAGVTWIAENYTGSPWRWRNAFEFPHDSVHEDTLTLSNYWSCSWGIGVLILEFHTLRVIDHKVGVLSVDIDVNLFSIRKLISYGTDGFWFRGDLFLFDWD